MTERENSNDGGRPDGERPSRVRAARTEKEVVFHTPVMLGRQAYRKELEGPRKLRYHKNDILNPAINEASFAHLPNGMLVDFPLVGLEEYWATSLGWLP